VSPALDNLAPETDSTMILQTVSKHCQLAFQRISCGASRERLPDRGAASADGQGPSIWTSSASAPARRRTARMARSPAITTTAWKIGPGPDHGARLQDIAFPFLAPGPAAGYGPSTAVAEFL